MSSTLPPSQSQPQPQPLTNTTTTTTSITSLLPTTSTYIDLQKLTSETFSPSTYANDLVRIINTGSTSTGTNTNMTTITPSTNPSDALVDLTTPLQKTLFDLQEIDSTIHNLTSTRALDILTYTSLQNGSAQRILGRVEGEWQRVSGSYGRLRGEVISRWERAEGVRVGAERSLKVVRLLRGVQRVIVLGRMFEGLLVAGRLLDGTGSPLTSTSSMTSTSTANTTTATNTKEDHRALLQATDILLVFRGLISAPETTKMDLGKLAVVRQVRGRIFEDGEERLKDWARKVVREFNLNSFLSVGTSSSLSSSLGLMGTSSGLSVGMSMSMSTRDLDTSDARSRFSSAIHILYLLSPTPRLEGGRKMKKSEFEPDDLLRSLQGFIQSAVSSCSAGIGRGLAQLPGLERALGETSGRCLSVRALEVVLGAIRVPVHPLLEGQRMSNGVDGGMKRRGGVDGDGDGDESSDDSDVEDTTVRAGVRVHRNGKSTTTEDGNPASKSDGQDSETVLGLLLSSLDTSSLTSYFWRSLASSLASKVQEIVNRGGVSARTLRSNKDMVRSQIRDCVLRGSKMPAGLIGQQGGSGSGRGEEVVVGNWEREAAVMVGSVVGALGR